MGKVLLAEGNVRQPSLAQVLGCPAHPGLLNWDAASPLPVLEISRPQALSVMVAGESGNPQSLLALDDRLQKAAEKARESFDMVIWDAPAMTRWSDAVALAGACDGVIVVIEMDETRVDALRFLRDTLARHRIPILGSVLNRTGRYWPRRRAAPAAAIETHRNAGDNPMSDYVLQAHDVAIHYGGVKAVDGINFSLPQGQTLGIVGESGSGKSTLGLAILRLIASKGGIRFEGQQLDKLTQQQVRPLRREMQVVFQDPFGSLSPRMSVQQIIAEGLLTHGIGTEAEREAAVVHKKPAARAKKGTASARKTKAGAAAKSAKPRSKAKAR